MQGKLDLEVTFNKRIWNLALASMQGLNNHTQFICLQFQGTQCIDNSYSFNASCGFFQTLLCAINIRSIRLSFCTDQEDI